MAKGLIIAAPRSGSGKTVLTLGLAAALRRRGLRIAPAKCGPDYIDPAYLALAAGREAVNLDPWAMSPDRLRHLASAAATRADLLLVEGVMGLFDGASDGTGSTADLAATLGLRVTLVVDVSGQAQSVAPLVAGFSRWRQDVEIAGLVLNRVAGAKHEAMLRAALAPLQLPVLGAVPRDEGLALAERHLGLVLPGELPSFDAFAERAASTIERHVDVDLLLGLAASVSTGGNSGAVTPLGQTIAVARDDAFAFLYHHLFADWRAAGADIRFFSPLADEAPPAADAVFLPGGYPELHGGRLSSAIHFRQGLHAAKERGALIYGECGGYMVLGEALVDKEGRVHRMAGLLPVTSRIDRPRRVLGYRRLSHGGQLPLSRHLNGHEFHYSSAQGSGGSPLFQAEDALGSQLGPMGSVVGRVMGSYAHVIDAA